MSCSNCNKSLPIVNKKYNLCNDCNYIRLNGKSRTEVYAQRISQKPQKVYKIPVKAKHVKQQTEKEKEVKTKLSILKDEIRLEAVQDNRYYCWGCGLAVHPLDCSHILSVGKYKHLELDKCNINLFCRGCHRKWESNIIEEMGALLTFESDLEYIKNHDIHRFRHLISRMERYLYWSKHTENELVRKFAKIIEKYPNQSCLR